ncbi:MAG: hypothetical protein KGH64_01945 [Candidatus Micrarchaeota archaeon]|nr:hypothetical protein [Candidatus Micrarchaeota archaeon]MDE1859792.1 hypothetical protein [Candidatus Micrarchaeota archaeon]
MPDEKPAYIAADVYTVSKQFGSGVAYHPLVFKDTSGAIVLTAAQGGFTGGKAALVDQLGNAVGTIQKKGFQFGNSATYLFFDGKSNQIGQIKINAGMMGMGEKVLMQDASGATVAMASGNIAGFNFEVTDAKGQKTLAKIYRDVAKQQDQQQGPGLGGMLASLAKQAISTEMSMISGAYKIEILEKSINDMSRLFILELVVVLDEMYRPSNQGAGLGMGGLKI